LKTHRLHKAQIGQAFPVIQEVSKTLTLDTWTDYAEGILSGPTTGAKSCGVIVAETQSKRIRGLFVYKVEDSLDHGLSLVIQHLVLPGLGRTTVATALYDSIRRLAAKNRCVCIRIEAPPDSKWDMEFFRKQGQRVINRLLCLPVQEFDPLEGPTAS
jgi:hypothetical protein